MTVVVQGTHVMSGKSSSPSSSGTLLRDKTSGTFDTDTTIMMEDAESPLSNDDPDENQLDNNHRGNTMQQQQQQQQEQDDPSSIAPLEDDFEACVVVRSSPPEPSVPSAATTTTTRTMVHATPTLRKRVSRRSSSRSSTRLTTRIPAQSTPVLLSATSKLFDRTDKGYLDSTERALRRLDTDHDGKLTVHNLYDMMQSLTESQRLAHHLLETLQEEQTNRVNLKKALVGLAVFAVLLCVANIGTSFAAARLAQDTQLSSRTGDLQSKETGIRVGTTHKLTGIELRPVSPPPQPQDDDDQQQRRLRQLAFDFCSPIHNNSDFSFSMRFCTVQALLDYRLAREIYRQLCPSLVTINGSSCPSPHGGLSELYLSCNGIVSQLLGGQHLPPTGPTVTGDGLTWFPTLVNDGSPWPTRFLGKIYVTDPFTWYCEQHFAASIVCNATADQDECFFFATVVGPACTIFQDTPDTNPYFDSDGLVICGLSPSLNSSQETNATTDN